MKKNGCSYYKVLEDYSQAPIDVVLHTILGEDTLEKNDLEDAWNYEISMSNTAGRWCSIVHVMALSSVLGKDIVSIIFYISKSRPTVCEPGNRVFTQAAAVGHFNDYVIGMEIDHLSALIRRVIRAYVAMRIKTYAKRYSKMIAHGNIPSSCHEMTKLILFKGT